MKKQLKIVSNFSRKLGLTNLLLIILVIFVIMSFFGFNHKNIFTINKTSVGSQNYTCKEKVTTVLDPSEACKEATRKAIKEGNLFTIERSECKTQFSVTEKETMKYVSKYELWYKFLNITYFKKEVPIDINFSGVFDCIIDNQ